MKKIKKLVGAGSSIPGAIREVLAQNGLTLAAFADKYERNRQNISTVVAGSRAPAADDVKAFIAELGGTETEWRELLHEAGRPTPVKAAVGS